MKINRAYKIRLYPNKEQEQKMLKILGCCRFIYNYYLDKRIQHYAETKKSLSYAELARDLTKFRYTINWLSDTQAEPLQQSLRRLETSYKRFFTKVSKFPKFKSKKDTRQSFQKHADWKIIDNKLQIQKDLIIKFRGNMPKLTKLGTLVVSRHSSGKWFATTTAKIEVKTPETYTKPIGIDVGLETLMTLSTGQKYANIQPQKTLQARLTKAQRDLARKQKGSKRREKARQEVARVHEKIRNIRENHLHQITSKIVSKNHAIIAIENLNVKGMMKNRHLSRSLGDASFGELFRQLKYKQAWKGGKLIEVGRFFPSSKTCSFCEFVVETLPLSVRKWACEKCGTKHDRDINAAKNILAEALKHNERGETKRVSVRRESLVS